MTRKLFAVALVGAVLVAAVWGISSAQSQARYQAVGGADARVGLVDLNYIFRNYQKYVQLTDQLKADLKDREQEIQQLRTQLSQVLNQRNQYNPDSPEYRQFDEKIARMKAQLDLKLSGTRREFQQRDAQLVYQTYREVEDVIQQVARSRGLTLVLQRSRIQKVDPSNPQDVFRLVNRQVVFAVPTMDITDLVLSELNRRAGTRQPLSGSTRQTPYRTGQVPGSRSIR